MVLALPVDYSENDWKRKDWQIHGICQWVEIVVEHKCDGDTNDSKTTRDRLQIFENGVDGIEIPRKNLDNTEHSIVAVGENTDKTSRLAGSL